MLAFLLAAALAAPVDPVPFPTSGTMFLETGWRFRAGDAPAWAAPDLDDGLWRAVAVPGRWSAQGLAAEESVGWYRLRFALAQPPAGALGVRFESVAFAFEVYVDGVRVGGVGGPLPSGRQRRAVPLTVALPLAALAPGPHVIAVRVSGAGGDGGLVGRVQAGDLDELRAIDGRADTSFFATALVLFGLAFYQLFFWVRRPQAREQLYLFLFVVSLGLFFLAWTPTARLAMSPWLSWSRLYIAFGALATGFFCHAYRRIFDLEGDRLLSYFGIYFHALVPFGLLLPHWSQLRVLVAFFLHPALIVTAVVLLVLAVRQVRLGVEHGRMLVWGAAPLTLALVHDIALDWGLLDPRGTFPNLIHVGVTAFALSVAYVTARRFVDSETLAIYDRLTGLYRREMVLDALKREIRRAARTRQPLAVIMMDIDHFKKVNDQFGHQVGDRVLAEIGRRLAEAGRAVDWLGRYGGEEFLAVLADSDLTGADLAAERFRTSVSALPIDAGRTQRVVTLSAGIAVYDGGKEWPTTETLIGAADAALYRAKAAGRNRTARHSGTVVD